jgi:hypothetical protein
VDAVPIPAFLPGLILFLFRDQPVQPRYGNSVVLV